MKFRFKIYVASFLQIPQIKFVNNGHSVVLQQESLKHAIFVSFYFSFMNLKVLRQWHVKCAALNAACQT